MTRGARMKGGTMARAKSDAASGDGAPLDFEQSMKRLETIVEELEAGELSLEDSIARYEEGIKLSRRLTQGVDESQKRIQRLGGKEGQGAGAEADGVAPRPEGGRQAPGRGRPL